MTTGVVIGRFQLASLHEGHIAVLSAVAAKHTRLVVLIGCTRAIANDHDPLPFFCREDAVRMVFPQATIMPLHDCHDDEDWSRSVDRLLEGFGDCVIYGGRASSIDKYSGRYPVSALELNIPISGTEIRKATDLGPSFEFRTGMVFQAKSRPAISFQTVDIAVLRDNHVLVGTKSGDKRWRFPGGFVDPKDASLEDAAARELMEETGLAPGVDAFRYVKSVRIDDWRYRGSVDKILTAFYVVPYGIGHPKAGDDLATIGWAPVYQLKHEIHPNHAPLVTALEAHLVQSQPHPATR